MTLKEFWAQTGRWLRVHNPLAQAAPQPEIGENGLISLDPEPDAPEPSDNRAMQTSDGGKLAPAEAGVVRAAPPADRQESLEKLQQGFEKLEATMTLLGRRLEPHELAPLAVYLASREAAAMTGQAINIDGGRLMS